MDECQVSLEKTFDCIGVGWNRVHTSSRRAKPRQKPYPADEKVWSRLTLNGADSIGVPLAAHRSRPKT